MQQEETYIQEARRDHHLTLLDKHPQRIANILIVDDDVDAMLAVQKTFGQMGCNIDFAFEAEEARYKISSGKADIIILDWMLNGNTSADQVMEGAIRRLKKFGRPDGGSSSKIKIITYSGKDSSDIHLPESPFFEHLDHWHKPILYPELIRKTLALMNRTGF